MRIVLYNKPFILVAMLLSASIIFASCAKDHFETQPLASLRIVNTITGGAPIKLGSNKAAVNNNAIGNFSLFTGNPDIYVWPTTDSLSPYYNSVKAVAIKEGEYYTLFLGGTPSTPEGILQKESFQNYSDSVMGIRFINLSPNSTPVNVTLSTTTGVNEFANIAFKQISDFKSFPASSTNSSYTFQVRSAATPATIYSTITISLTGTAAIPRFKNVSLVFRGTVGGNPAPGITRVDHY